jgi:hypothetical protein
MAHSVPHNLIDADSRPGSDLAGDHYGAALDQDLDGDTTRDIAGEESVEK